MTVSQEVVLMQLLQKIASQGDHLPMDQLLLQVLQKIGDRLDTILDLLMVLNGRSLISTVEHHE